MFFLFVCFFFLVSLLTDSTVLQTINRKGLVHGKERVRMILADLNVIIVILICRLSPKEIGPCSHVFRDALSGLR